MGKSAPVDDDDDASSSASSPQRRLPLLMLSPEPNRPNLRRFFNLETRETVWVPVPDAVATHDIVCFSSNGWLLNFSNSLSMSLVNPLTSAVVPLSHGGDGGSLDDFEEFFDDKRMGFITKFAMSNSVEKDDSFCVAIVYGDVGKVAIWRNGDDAWTRVVYDEDGKQLRAFKDIVYYRGVFYVLKLGMGGRIFSFGVDTGRGEVRARLVADVSKSECFPASVARNYLVVSGGTLLVVFRNTARDYHDRDYNYDYEDNNEEEDNVQDEDEAAEDNDTVIDEMDVEEDYIDEIDNDGDAIQGWNGNGFIRTGGFKILRLSDLDKEDGGVELLEDLGDESLFLGSNQSISIKASECPGCKANCIYFTDDWYDRWPIGQDAGRDMGIYHLRDGTIEPFYEVNDSFISFITSVWVEPSLFDGE